MSSSTMKNVGMKRVAVVGVEKEIIEDALKARGFFIDKFEPDIVVSFGGDGSALNAEQLYPGVPRLTIKHSQVCEKCIVGSEHDFSDVLGKLKKGDYKIVSESKVEGIVNDEKHKILMGLNEINVSHAVPTRAIRFDVSVDNDIIAANMIGDGVLVATPYGSTGYFRVITGRTFSEGLGIALNNVSQKIKSRMVGEGAEVRIRLNRGPALMCADNNTTMIPLKDEDVVTVRKSKDSAKLIVLSGEEKKIKV